jgi:putative glutamine amidotransferase
MSKPLIGLTASHGTISDWGQKERTLPQTRLNFGFTASIFELGGIPLILPTPISTTLPKNPDTLTLDPIFFENAAEQTLSPLDGLVLTGGGDVIRPSIPLPQGLPQILGFLDSARDLWEKALLKKALGAQMPILGICRGLQLLNVFCGGTLYNDLPSEIPGVQEHRQRTVRAKTSHKITVKPNSLLNKITGCLQFMVNSGHHQGVKDMAPNLVATAHSPDGVIEAMEDPNYPFCLTVQWHPEGLTGVSKIHASIFQGFVKASIDYQKEKKIA